MLAVEYAINTRLYAMPTTAVCATLAIIVQTSLTHRVSIDPKHSCRFVTILYLRLAKSIRYGRSNLRNIIDIS